MKGGTKKKTKNNYIYPYKKEKRIERGKKMNEYDYIVNAFTKEGENTNLEVNNLETTCITSPNNKFNLDSNGNLTVRSITTLEGTTDVSLIYPIGSIYMTIEDINPQDYFGGTWERIRDVFLLACGDTYTNGETGGAKEVALTKEQMPEHSHKENSYNLYNIAGGLVLGSGNACYANAHVGYYTENAGEGKPHNNMPPYLAVYVWKRTA